MENFTVDVKAVTGDGEEVPIKITVEHPRDQGIFALQALQHIAANKNADIVASLAYTGDQSALSFLREMGLDLDDDGEE